MEILFYTDMHLNTVLHAFDADGIGMHGALALPVLQAIQEYAMRNGIRHIINGGDSVNFDIDQDAYRRNTQTYDALTQAFRGSSTTSLGNHDFHDLIQAFIGVSANSTNMQRLKSGNQTPDIDLITLQPSARKHPDLRLNFDYNYDEFEALATASTADHLIISSHWSLGRHERMSLKQKPYAFTRNTPEFPAFLNHLARAGKKIINLSGHEHSFHFDHNHGYKTLVMPSPVQDDVRQPANPCGLFTILKIDDAGEFSLSYKRVILGATMTPFGQPISIDVADVNSNYMQQYSRQALGRIKPDAPQP